MSPASLDEAKARVAEVVDRLADDLERISHQIHANPELCFEEHKAAAWLGGFLARQGATVEHGVGGLPTAFRATIVGRDASYDLAVLRTERTGLRPLTMGASKDVVVGDQVIAVGAPLGLESTVTSGIVSALNRPVNVGQVSQGNSTVYPAIQTDAAINPGNSGGPLVNLAGEVVGIDAAIQTATNQGLGSGEPGSIGLGFAIPIDEVLPIVQQMIKGETPTHARLGIAVENASSGSNGAQIASGAKIQQINAGSPAATAGPRPRSPSAAPESANRRWRCPHPPLHLQGRGTARSAVEGLLALSSVSPANPFPASSI